VKGHRQTPGGKRQWKVLDRFSQVDLPVIPSGQHSQHDLHTRNSSSQAHACLLLQLSCYLSSVVLYSLGCGASRDSSDILAWKHRCMGWATKAAGEKSADLLKGQEACSAAVLLHKGAAAADASRRWDKPVQEAHPMTYSRSYSAIVMYYLLYNIISLLYYSADKRSSAKH